MKLNRMFVGGVLLAMSLGAFFVLRDLGQKSVEIPSEMERVPASEAPEMTGEDFTWAQEPVTIMRTLQNGEDYYALVAVGETAYRELLPIGALEYRILEKGDQADALYIEMDQAIDYINWIRDENGRLTIYEDRPIVVVDAGHGGYDQGQGSNDLWLEKEMTLIMASALAEALEAQGIRAIMTRQEDRYIDLYDRAAIADYVDADMFVSCHLNRVSWEASGVEILYSQKSDSAYAMDLAEAIAGDDFTVYRVYNRKSEDLPGTDYYFVHKYTDSPSYIIEFGFADNESDTAYIKDNWQLMVDRASESISNYIKEKGN